MSDYRRPEEVVGIDDLLGGSRPAGSTEAAAPTGAAPATEAAVATEAQAGAGAASPGGAGPGGGRHRIVQGPRVPLESPPPADEVPDSERDALRLLGIVGGAAALVLLIVLLVLTLGGEDPARDVTGAAPDNSGSPSVSASATPTGTGSPTPAVWRGAVVPVAIVAVEASCESSPSRDAAGQPVTYVVGNAVDDDPGTAWRCGGDGVGQRITIDLGSAREVAELALIPGYAKTDAADGTDRYRQNRRLALVRWEFDDGTTVEHVLDTSPDLRTPQALRTAPVQTQRIVMTILESSAGDRNFVAVSDLRVAARG